MPRQSIARFYLVGGSAPGRTGKRSERNCHEWWLSWVSHETWPEFCWMITSQSSFWPRPALFLCIFSFVSSLRYRTAGRRIYQLGFQLFACFFGSVNLIQKSGTLLVQPSGFLMWYIHQKHQAAWPSERAVLI